MSLTKQEKPEINTDQYLQARIDKVKTILMDTIVTRVVYYCEPGGALERVDRSGASCVISERNMSEIMSLLDGRPAPDQPPPPDAT